MTPVKFRLFFKRFKPMGCTSKNFPKEPDPLNPGKQQVCLFLDYHLLNKSVNATNNGKKVISYYPLPNITDLLARLWNCKIFSSWDLRSGYHLIGLTPKVKPNTAFATRSGKWHWNVAPFRICPIPTYFAT